MRSEPLMMVLGFIISLAILFLILKFVSCKYVRVCVLDVSKNWKKYEFDCDIIYSRLGKYWNENSGYAYGSLAHIEITACSDEVLSILEKRFNVSLPRDKCHFSCCVTDGTCNNGVAVNVQGYWWE